MNLPPGLVPPNKTGKCDLPNVLLCFKALKSADDKSKKGKEYCSGGSGDGGGGGGGDHGKKHKKRSKSRELRCGILYIGCECERRNGLQDQCPRTGCQGAPECLELPPTCAPSEFAQGKHMAKHYAKHKKAREDFIKKWKEIHGGGSGGGGGGGDRGGDHGSGKNDKTDYDCFPLDQLIKEGMPCPICNRVMNGCSDKKDGKPKDGAIIIDFPVECLCCPGAS